MIHNRGSTRQIHRNMFMRSSLARWTYAGLLMTAIAGCGKSEDKAAGPTTKPADVVEVTVAPVRVERTRRTVDVTGTLYGDEETTVSAKVPGRIIKVHRDVGDRLSAAEPLAEIERTDYELAVSQRELAVNELLARLGLDAMPQGDVDPETIPTVKRARLQAENAKARFNRGKQLHDQSPPLMSDQDFADLQTAYEVAKSEYDVAVLTAKSLLAEARTRQVESEQASQRLADATIRAPGQPQPNAQQSLDPSRRQYIVAARLVSEGEYVREGTTLYRLIDPDPIKLRASVPERYASAIATGGGVRVRVESYGDEFFGQISRITPQVDPATRTFQIEALIPNPDGKLRAGAFATAVVDTVDEPEVVLAPASAVSTFAGVHRAFIIKDDKVEEKRLELTANRNGDWIQVARGLGKTDQVITSSAGRLVAGGPVTVRAVAAKE